METTPADFELFKQECYRWIDILGLKSWHIVFVHAEDDSCGNAVYFRESASRLITINLNRDFDGLMYSEDGIKRTAFHEVVEGLLLARLDDMIDRRKYGQQEIEEARHEVTRILEATLFTKY